jgi:hypothetical protein
MVVRDGSRYNFGPEMLIVHLFDGELELFGAVQLAAPSLLLYKLLLYVVSGRQSVAYNLVIIIQLQFWVYECSNLGSSHSFHWLRTSLSGVKGVSWESDAFSGASPVADLFLLEFPVIPHHKPCSGKTVEIAPGFSLLTDGARSPLDFDH